MSNQTKSIPLIIFAKAPIPGQVKTRLQPELDEQQAAQAAQLLLRATVQRAVEYWPGEIFLSAGLDANHPVLLEIAATFKLRVDTQPS